MVAILAYVPITVSRFPSELWSSAETPKSASFTRASSVIRILAAFLVLVEYSRGLLSLDLINGRKKKKCTCLCG